jgi:hypothetical protein
MEAVVLINLAIYSLMARWLEGQARQARGLRARVTQSVPDPNVRAASAVGWFSFNLKLDGGEVNGAVSSTVSGWGI